MAWASTAKRINRTSITNWGTITERHKSKFSQACSQVNSFSNNRLPVASVARSIAQASETAAAFTGCQRGRLKKAGMTLTLRTNRCIVPENILENAQ
jgi:hypothetical protein